MSAKLGRRPKYDAAIHPKRARELAKRGLVDREIAAAFGIHRDTLYAWQRQFPDFSDALKKGKQTADQHVEAALYRRAVGYDYVELTTGPAGPHSGRRMRVVKAVTKHVPPDPTSMIFWLKNRLPREWRDARDLRRHEIPLNDDPFEGIPADKREEAIARFESIFPQLRFAHARGIVDLDGGRT